MRSISPDSYSFGDTFFPWGGLIEPKLLQRVPWILFISVPSAIPIKVPLRYVSYLTEEVNALSLFADLSISKAVIPVTASQPETDVAVSSNKTSVLAFQAKQCVRAITSSIEVNVGQDDANVATVSPRNSILAKNKGVRVSVQSNKSVLVE